MDSDAQSSPWHAGERAIHARLGYAERMESVGRAAIRHFMPDQHRLFFAQLPFLLLATKDGAGQPWATLLWGPPGFARSPDPHRLDIAALPEPGDPAREGLTLGAQVGLLGIELPTRRRNRLNGRVVALDGEGFSVEAEQSFGNCPQYIQRRDYLAWAGAPAAGVRVESFSQLGDEARALVGGADTLFVASASAAGAGEGSGLDVSHRGGRPGFLRVGRDGAILVPDFRGNRFFNTLGNLLANPRAGLLFVDFERGDLMQVAGETEIVWEGSLVSAFRGAERLWRLFPREGRWIRGGMALRFARPEASPQSLGTGSWREAGPLAQG